MVGYRVCVKLAVIVGLIIGVTSVVGAEGISRSGSVTLTLSPLASESDATDERWRIRARDVGSSREIEGTIRIGGLPLQRPDQLGRVAWKVTGTTLSGTVTSPVGETLLATFAGTIRPDGMKGEFQAINGQRGSWEWEGPVPQLDSATDKSTTE